MQKAKRVIQKRDVLQAAMGEKNRSLELRWTTIVWILQSYKSFQNPMMLRWRTLSICRDTTCSMLLWPSQGGGRTKQRYMCFMLASLLPSIVRPMRWHAPLKHHSNCPRRKLDQQTYHQPLPWTLYSQSHHQRMCLQ